MIHRRDTETDTINFDRIFRVLILSGTNKDLYDCALSQVNITAQKKFQFGSYYAKSNYVIKSIIWLLWHLFGPSTIYRTSYIY
jgi:hypothetical protein